ncbi:MAG: hypothetical protein GY771_15360 [bacterium]|nr:hypothetical protein [bacterium]
MVIRITPIPATGGLEGNGESTPCCQDKLDFHCLQYFRDEFFGFGEGKLEQD